MDGKETRKCRHCGTEISLNKGRRDRLFCDEICKNRYHNDIYFEKNSEFRRINRILKKNRDILKFIMGSGNYFRISHERLKEAGFDFDYYTHSRNYEDSDCFFCYEYGYLKELNPYTKNESYGIVKCKL